MNFDCKVKHIFDVLINPTPQDLKTAIELLDIQLEDLYPYLVHPDKHPYGRKLVYQSDYVEILVSGVLPKSPKRGN
ncbi:hypothetical protein [Bacillus thuringiensis]|uniref:hypothetical protein n=1 Tax=Bacillus thuringiensis TaxID=1428 RepID=UPI0011A0B238|nr:hypothetical protein [Bacillus thuringiensis]